MLFAWLKAWGYLDMGSKALHISGILLKDLISRVLSDSIVC
jgi:hypothetical protein